MTDLASLVLAVDSTQVKAGTASLDGLTAAGARAEAATVGFGRGSKTAAAEAAAMAAAAQASARAATGMATGFKASGDALRVNTIAMRETLVVARELSRGNFTRLPGSLTLLAQGISAQGGGLSGFISALGKTLGLVKTVQNAELAEAATNAAAAAEAVENAARRAAANIMAADTELALAEAQLQVTHGTSAESAAQLRVAEAHQAVAAAAGEAAIAERALSTAYAASAEAGAASAATTTTAVTGLGAALGVAAIAAGLAAVSLASVKDAAEEADPSAQHFIATLGLTSAEVKKLKDTTVTWGDVAKGTFDAVAAAAGVSSSQFKSFWREAFLQTAQVGVSAAQVIAGAFAAVGSIANNLKGLAIGVVAPGNPLAGAGSIPSPQKVGQDALNAFQKQFAATGKFFHETLPGAINASRDTRLQSQANKLIGDRSPSRARSSRGANDNADESIRNEKAYQDEVARLNDQILAAKKQLAGSVEEQAQFALQQIDVEKNKTVDDAKALLAQHKISAGEEQHLELLAGQLADLKKQAVLREEQTKLLTQQQAAQDQLFGFQTDALKFADDMATTQADHRKAQLDLLDIAYQQKAYDLQILQSKQELAKDFAAAAITQGQINNLPTEQARDRARVLKNTLNPLEQWAKTVPQTAQEITEAFQSIQAHGLDTLTQGITDVITGTKSLGSAFKDVARSIIGDIIQMTVRMLVFRAISSAFGGLFGGGSPGDLAVTLPTATPVASLPGFADGGSFTIGGNSGVDQNVLSINGQPKVRVGNGETLAVFPRGAANNNNRGPIEVHVTLVADAGIDARIEDVSARQIGQAAPAIVRASVQQTMRVAGRPKLMGR